VYGGRDSEIRIEYKVSGKPSEMMQRPISSLTFPCQHEPLQGAVIGENVTPTGNDSYSQDAGCLSGYSFNLVPSKSLLESGGAGPRAFPPYNSLSLLLNLIDY